MDAEREGTILRNYGFLARVTIGVGAATMIVDHWLGPLGEEPGLIFLFGALWVGIGMFMIPDKHTPE